MKSVDYSRFSTQGELKTPGIVDKRWWLLGKEELPQALSQIAPDQARLANMENQITELRTLIQAPKPIRKEETPQPRGLSASLVHRAAIEKLAQPKGDQFDRIAQATVGLATP